MAYARCLDTPGRQIHAGGLVISPSVDVLCAYPEDGNSMNKVCEPLGGDGVTCIPGCSGRGETCEEVGHDWACSFGGANRLRDALRAQQARGSYRARNNEIVIGIRSIASQLPHVIQAFFYVPFAEEAEIARARQAHAAFLAEFGMSREEGPPLLTLDLRLGAGQAPFGLDGTS